MIAIVYGTTGELIKLWPLLVLLEPRTYLTVCTNQQPQHVRRLREAARIADPDFTIGTPEEGSDINGFRSAPRWLVRVWAGFLRNRTTIRRAITSNSERGLVLVHGDTPTTVVGSLMGKSMGFPVAHIEAGMRSDDWRHPFPEEISRTFAGKIARLHFAPGDAAVENLERHRVTGRIINTHYNTVIDSLKLAQSITGRLNIPAHLPDRYCIVSLHRNELLQTKEFKYILEKIRSFAARMPIIFIDHPITEERIKTLQLDEMLQDKDIIRLPKQSYPSFIRILAKADCLITDSGGLQQEAAYLGIPCLVHRRTTEGNEGLGGSVVLSRYDPRVVDEFCANYKRYKGTRVNQRVSPSEIILSALETEGYLEPCDAVGGETTLGAHDDPRRSAIA